LQNAASVASLILTTDAMIADTRTANTGTAGFGADGI